MVNNKNIQRTFFVVLLVFVTIAFVWLIRGFMQPIFWAVALAIVFYPTHKLIERKLPKRPNIAAGLSVVAVLLVVVLPIIGIAAAVTREAGALYQQLPEWSFCGRVPN
jgi:predicted PurR-regulated permease PerM